MSTPTGDGAHAARNRSDVGNTTLDLHDHSGLDRKIVVDRESDAHGGVKVGSSFFGWLTATGTAIGLASSAGTGQAVAGAQDEASANAGTIGLGGGIAVLVVLLVAYFCGGYIALLAAVVAALIGAILGGLARMRFHRRVDRAGLGR